MHAPHTPHPLGPFGNRPKALDSFALPPGLEEMKVSPRFSPQSRGKPGPKGPAQELIDAVVQIKQRNPTWGCPRIAEQVSLTFGVEIDKGVVRRILASRPAPRTGGSPWLTYLGDRKGSLWSVDLFRCESATVRTYWVLVVMDQYTRAIWIWSA
jgi:hypothetical protein